MRKITDAQLTHHAARFYDEDSGMEVVIPCQHIVIAQWDGVTLTITTTISSGCPPLEFQAHPDYPEVRDCMDEFVRSLITGRES